MSDAFRAAILTKHTEPVLRIDVLDSGVVVASSTAALDGVDLEVRGGGVDEAARAGVRRSGSADFVDTAGVLEAVASGSLLDPLSGREFRLWRGLRLATGDELVPLGTFGIEEATVEHSRDGLTVQLAGRDRSAAVSEGGWLAPYTASDGTKTLADAVRDTVAFRLGVSPSSALPFSAEAFAYAYTVPRLSFGGDAKNDPWSDVEAMAAGGGGQVLFDRLGALVLRKAINPAEQPVSWTHSRTGTGLLTYPARRRIDRKTLVNGVTMRSSAPWLLFPVEATAWDTNPASPTYAGILPDGVTPDPVNPGIGKHPEVVEDAVLGSTAQALVAATALLPSRLGIEELVDLNMMPLPFLDAEDVIVADTLVLAGGARLSIDSTHHPIDRTSDQPVSSKRRRQ